MKKVQRVDEALLNSYIDKSGLKIEYLCEQMGIETMTFLNKRKGKVLFKVSEIFVLCTLLKIADEDKAKIFYPI